MKKLILVGIGLREVEEIEIRNKYIKNKYGVRKIAKEYGVYYGTIQRIIWNETWQGI